MKLFPKADFGLRVLIDISLSTNGLTNADEILKRQKISDGYLGIILYQLERKGLVKQEKNGAGERVYFLAKPASIITVTEIIESFEEKFIMSNNTKADELGFELEKVINQNVWEIVWQALRKESDKITLEQIVTTYKNINSFMQFI